MQVKINTLGIVNNLQNVAGWVVGKTVCKAFGLRFGKEHRGMHKLFSHVAANLAADNEPQDLFCFRMIIIK